MAKDKEKKLTVKDLIDVLGKFEQQGQITMDTEVWLSSDEEGNAYSPLMRFKDGVFNIGIEQDKSRITLYPSSAHEEGY